MRSEWVPTDEYYHRILDAPDDSARRTLYRKLFMEPWQSLMGRAAGMMGATSQPDDEFAAPRALNWLVPDDLSTTPPALSALEAVDAWTTGAAALAEGVSRLAAYNERVTLDSVTGWLVLADPQRSDPIMRGYTGAIDWPQPRFICQFDTPNDYNLPRLPGLIVHELHHLIRLALYPWGPQTTVADYIILEGLAESFAAALYGEEVVGYYVTEFEPAELDTARALIRDGLHKSGFDVIRAYIFGDHWSEKLGLPLTGMPTYGGYAMGYRAVQAFLKRTGQSVEQVTLLPADDIILESGFFD